MKLLMENWRKFLNEGMKQPSDLPEGIQLRIEDDGSDVSFKIVNGRTGKEPTKDEQIHIFGRIFGELWISQWGDKSGGGTGGGLCTSAFEVRSSRASGGWGPILYDLAMEYATKNGSGLMSDRQGVSEDAYLVWKRYMDERDDVEKIQLDDLINTLTPEEKDNCAQLSSQRWAEKNGGEWHHKPISMLYRKNNTEMFDKLKSTGKLYGESALEEVYSDKQRKWACAQIKNPTSLTKAQAKEMCSGPTKK